MKKQGTYVPCFVGLLEESLMNTTQRGLLLLLKSAITGEQQTLPEDFRLEDANELICGQSLLPLAYQGAYLCGLSLKTELMQKYQKQYYKMLMHNERQLRAVEQLCCAFEENGIDYMPLKGCNLKQLYPQPEMRPMGDADILIRLEQYDRIRPLMLSLGYTEEGECGNEMSWSRRDLFLELHKCFVAPDSKDLYAYFGDGWARAVWQDGHRYGLRPEDEFIFIFAHMTKHYRNSGIGSRQFVDLYVYRRAHPMLDEAYIEGELGQIRLLTFYRNVMNLLDVWFESKESDERADLMTEYILSGGNWGDLETGLLSRQLKQNKGAPRHAKIKILLRSIFLPLEQLQNSFPVLRSKPYLYPFFVPIRWIRLMIFRPGMVWRKLSVLNRVTDEKVSNRKDMLRFMGIDFDDE